jgi:DNA mismatch repair protein MutL
MGTIRLLDPEVASRIAAGEVVERPASVLKELLENAIDAGATKIQVSFARAGKESLRVADDGRGMDPEDCELALKRHATSKILAFEDLDRLATYGFRGEALFAVAAVSRLTLTSRPRGAASAWKIEAQAGAVSTAAPAAAAEGTAVEVHDLFFNTPARLKFLRSDAVEKSRLLRALEEAALANPRIRFSWQEGSAAPVSWEEAREKERPAALRERFRQIVGRDLGENLIETGGSRGDLRLTMLASSPDDLVSTRQLQYWYVNGRPVSSRLLQQALYKAYSEFRPRDRHPVCAGFLSLDAASFDVNIHPSKREVRFDDEAAVFDLVWRAIAQALVKARGAVPLLVPGFAALDGARDAQAPSVSDAAAPYGGKSGDTLRQDAPGFSPARLTLGTRPAHAGERAPGDPAWFTPPYRFLGRVESLYLIFESAGGLFLLDQHAANERVLFEKYWKAVEEGSPRAQALMIPLPVELPASAAQNVLSRRAELSRFGFLVEPFGKTALRVVEAPEFFARDGDLKEAVFRLIESLASPADASKALRRHAAATIACKKAVKAHDPLGEPEALALLEALRLCEDGARCPHGRPSMLALSRDELARRFGRPGAP